MVFGFLIELSQLFEIYFIQYIVITQQANKVVQAFGIGQYFFDAEHFLFVFNLTYLLRKQRSIFGVVVKQHFFYFFYLLLNIFFWFKNCRR